MGIYEPVSKVDPGELIITVAENADAIDIDLQKQIARFLAILITPVIHLEPGSHKIGVEINDRDNTTGPRAN